MARLLVASSRLPSTVRLGVGDAQVEPGAGPDAGLLPDRRSGGLWIGWTGSAGERDEAGARSLASCLEELRLVPVPLAWEEVARHHDRFSNGVLRPAFHDLAGQLPLEAAGLDYYQRANSRFADALAERHRPGDLVWVHDYELMCLPLLLRQRLPDATIGFFLHIPFPPPETFRLLPGKERLLEGLLGADLIGFRAPAYRERFSASVLHILGAPLDVDRVRWRGRETRLGVFPAADDADAHRWAREFLERLEEVAGPAPDLPPPPAQALEEWTARIRRAAHTTLLLDYDGTLVPFAPAPELALPDPELLELLRSLAAGPRRAVHVISGRGRETLERWLGDLPIGLHAEHGLWTRMPGAQWQRVPVPAGPWRDAVRAVLAEFEARTPGSLIEEKTAGLAWHYRAADPGLGSPRARDLMARLATLLAGAPVEVIPGDKVVEVRPRGVNKGGVVGPIAASSPPGSLLVAIGDDRTDEDLFAALPPQGIAFHVGASPSRAPLRLRDFEEVRRLLRSIL